VSLRLEAAVLCSPDGDFRGGGHQLGRLSRVWPETVFPSGRAAMEFSVRFAQDAGMEEYLEERIEVTQEAENVLEEM